MPEHMGTHDLTGEQEAYRRQRHDEYSCSADHSADYDHSVRCKLLRQRTYDRHQANDNDRVDGRKLTHGRVHPEFANAELWKHVIHLQTDGCERSDEEEGNKHPIVAGLTDQPSETISSEDDT